MDTKLDAEPYKFFSGYELVLSRFGQWPSFHDGEVHRLVLDRMNRNAQGSYVPTVEIHVRGWTMKMVDGRYVLEHDSVVHLLFEDVFDFELEGFNSQNVLSSLNLELVPDAGGCTRALHIELEHCYMFCGQFSARKATVLKVEPFAD
ncbi:Imm50 family immunity protein [Variovorax sp. KK3]|uniref:Imm50 family immunity protein n=1 Tax=Variovorax sp. KK3 TaxID=1855728 RepID=UPI00097C412F|nr:Imm50 family immunity protein [Variovorax sp. KK3]